MATPGADAAPGVRYSVDTWRDQVEHFLLERVRAPAFLAGNSLGGYIATYVAATAPDLCAGLVLMNATPFWAFLPADPDAPGRRVASGRANSPSPAGSKPRYAPTGTRSDPTRTFAVCCPWCTPARRP